MTALRIADMPHPARIRKLLRLRSMRDKIGVQVAPPQTLAVKDAKKSLAYLIDSGYLTWIDRAVVSELHVLCDIYQLTPKGVELCNTEGIPGH